MTMSMLSEVHVVVEAAVVSIVGNARVAKEPSERLRTLMMR